MSVRPHIEAGDAAQVAAVTVPALSNAERAFLAFALDLAADAMANDAIGFGPDDDAALASLRKLACNDIAPAAESIDATAATVQADDALSPTLRRLRDAILAEPAMTPAEALLDAQELLADHARELGTLVHNAIARDRAWRPGAADRRRHSYRAGMTAARLVIDQYADDLDTAGGGA